MYSARRTAALPAVGFPIRTSPDQSLVSGSPTLFAATHVLLRLLSPRHPSCALRSLVISLLFVQLLTPQRPRSSALLPRRLSLYCLLAHMQLSKNSSESLGGADRDRTDDIQLAKLALSQLSYGPASSWLVGLDRFELSTPRLSSVCSNQLSYRPGAAPLPKSFQRTSDKTARSLKTEEQIPRSCPKLLRPRLTWL